MSNITNKKVKRKTTIEKYESDNDNEGVIRSEKCCSKLKGFLMRLGTRMQMIESDEIKL